MGLIIEELQRNQITTLKKLWTKLNEQHLNNSTHFKDHYRNFKFEERFSKFSEYESDKIKIDVLKDKELNVGYCISTIDDTKGELDSLFIDSKYRKFGYGQKLAERSIIWLKKNNCHKIIVSVAEGNESVLDFYKKLGFFPRLTSLQLK